MKMNVPFSAVLLKKFRRLLRQALQLLPAGTRGQIERRLLNINLNGLSENFVFKLAETQAELEQAFSLLHDSYVREGFMEAHPSGLRVTAYHALPTTTTLIAKLDDVVVGTVSLIRQTSLGLPLQTAFDLSSVVQPGDQVVEISSLAIHPAHRGQQTQLLFWLSKYVLDYCRKYFVVDYIFVAINPKQIDLYENILLFQRLPGDISQYNFANGAPAVAEYVDLSVYANRLLGTYWSQPPKRNVYAFCMIHQLPKQFKFPPRPVFTVSDPVMTPELLKYFYAVRTHGFQEMSEIQLATLHKIYQDFPAFLGVLPPRSRRLARPVSTRSTRFQVHCPGTLSTDARGSMVEIEILQVSLSGFRARSQERLEVGTSCTARVRISAVLVIELDATVIWSHDAGLVGFEVPRPIESWEQFISHLSHRRNKAHRPAAEVRFLAPIRGKFLENSRL